MVGNGRAIQRRGRLGFAGARLKQVAARGHEQRAFAVAIARITAPTLYAHAGEEIGKGVVLIVGPFLQRMIVALGAVDG